MVVPPLARLDAVGTPISIGCFLGIARGFLMVSALNVAQATVVYSIKAHRFREELAVRADHVLSVVIEPRP